jgi:hypothetical protein
VAEQVLQGGNIGFGAFSVSENGILAFRSGGAAFTRELVWMDRTGKRLGAVGKPGEFAQIAVSPDEKTVAVVVGDTPQSDIWLQDLERGVLSRFTFRPGNNRDPIWSPDGSRLVFAVQTLGSYSYDMYQKPAGGNIQEELLRPAGIRIPAGLVARREVDRLYPDGPEDSERFVASAPGWGPQTGAVLANSF